ncbi:methyltransferase domain-containing protein [Candidatus Omnitrophota bacterium]
MNSGERHLYTQIDQDFYRKQQASKNPLRSWYHNRRYQIADSLVKSKYQPGQKIIDLGCGSCDWNRDQLDVFGVDYNEGLLALAKQKNRISDYKIAAVTRTELPDQSFDIVTAFELLEHIYNYPQLIIESRRLLKTGGHCIISVPYDVLFSLWRPLFFLHSVWQGHILQNAYYKKNCGHLHRFSVPKLIELFSKYGFNIDSISVMRWFTIFLSAQKK